MIGPLASAVGTVPGPPDFALLHEGAMPQKDQLCGAFWASLTLSVAGHPASQEEVALRAGTTLAEGDPAGWLPLGAAPRLSLSRPQRLSPSGRHEEEVSGIRSQPSAISSQPSAKNKKLRAEG